MEQNNQIKKGIVLSYTTLFLSNIVGLFITPFLVKSLGASEYGLYALIGAFVGYIAILDFGINNAIIRYVAKYRAEKNKLGEENFLAITFILYTVIALIIIFTGMLLYFNIDQIFSESLTDEELEKAKIMFIILVANLALSLPLGSFTAILTGYEKFVIPQIIGILRIIVRAIIVIALLLWGFKAVAIVILDSALNVISMSSLAIIAIRKYDIRIKLHNFDKKLVKEIFGFSFWVFLVMIVDQIYWKLGQGVLGVLANTEAVAVFAIGLQLAMYLIPISMGISRFFYPKITTMVTNNSSGENLTDLMIKIGRFQFLIVGFIFCGFLLLGDIFIDLWVGSDYYDSWIIAVALMASLVLPLSSNTGMFILLAKKKHSFRAIIYLFVALINFILSVFLAKKLGSLGVALATAFSLTINTILINIYYHKVIKLNILRFLKEFQKGILISLIFSFGTTKIAIFLLEFETSWISLIFYVIIFSSLYVGALWLFGTNEYERNFFSTSLKEFKKKINDKFMSSPVANN